MQRNQGSGPAPRGRARPGASVVPRPVPTARTRVLLRMHTLAVGVGLLAASSCREVPSGSSPPAPPETSAPPGGGSGSGVATCAPVLPVGGDCNPVSGFGAPLPTCSAADPCDRPLDPARGRITRPTEVPRCRTTNPAYPPFDDGAPSRRAGIDGTARYACAYAPPDAATTPRPLLLFFHGSSGTADAVYDATLLRQKAETYDLSGDPRAPGFVLVSVQGRNLHWPNATPQDGSKHDIYYRDLSTCSTNPDFAEADRRIDEWVASGRVDASRIYVSGWSNGARFAQAYAIARHETPTPGGHRVAAAAVYAGADPFGDTIDGQVPSCRLAPYPTSDVPLLLVSGWCDLMPCDAQQLAGLSAEIGIAPGSLMSAWVEDLATEVGNPHVSWRTIRGTGDETLACMPADLCTATVALAVHAEWPDGIAGAAGGVVDWEPELLDFLRSHPLP
jgi:poly(3-hydroxybutyrate) depolymerase